MDDGTAAAHRPLLMARCDVMQVMFAGNFRESKAKIVSTEDAMGTLSNFQCQWKLMVTHWWLIVTF